MAQEKQLLLHSFALPALCLLLLWLIHLFQVLELADLVFLGVYPRRLSGLIGILTAPGIHGSVSHLASNSLPFLFLSAGLLYFYRSIALPVWVMGYLLPGLGVWLLARPSFHIGVSGLIYALAFFLFFSGVFRKDIRAMALALIVSFFYGSMIWGVLPGQAFISWEGHLFGALTGIGLAYAYRKKGPQRKRYAWEDEPDDDQETGIWDYQQHFPPPPDFPKADAP